MSCIVHHRRRPRSARTEGAVAVEFALVSLVFFSMLFGAMELGRLMFFWNTAAEVTRLGARMAVVCDPNATSRDAIRARMRQLLPIVAAADITVAGTPAGCDDTTPGTTCQLVTVSITTTTPIQTYIPFVPLSVLMPAFSTTLPRESMQSTFGGVANPACQ
jgi:Flp pilus assembly protein TadG